jgi:hypothetical protein
MGLFLALSGIIGQTQESTIAALKKYAAKDGGELEPAEYDADNNELCVIAEENGNTTVFFLDGYFGMDQASKFLSEELSAPVFALHIHDGDFWIYTLYHDGRIVDQFNPIPDYWDDDISEEELADWQGDAATIVKYVPAVQIKDINRYLVRWDLEVLRPPKAYHTDEFAQEDWQLLDFMRRLGLPYPVANDLPNGQVFRLNKSQN